MHKCKVCGKTFLVESELEIHRKSEHGAMLSLNIRCFIAVGFSTERDRSLFYLKEENSYDQFSRKLKRLIVQNEPEFISIRLPRLEKERERENE